MRKIDVEQGSYDWHLLRQGCVTGTTLKSALGSAKVQETLLNKLIAERMTELQIDDVNSKHMERGRELEPLARKAVIESTGIEFIETGVLEDETLQYFKISPDGIFEQDGVIVGGLEIKCPDSKKHIEYLRNDEVPKDYYHQVYAPFLMSDDVQWWLFASYDDRNYEKPLFIHRVNRNDVEIENGIADDREKLKQFLDAVNSEHESLSF